MLKFFAYIISVILIIAGFCLPPVGIIHPSVLTASGILLGGYQLLFGKSIKSIHISKGGIDIETFENQKTD